MKKNQRRPSPAEERILRRMFTIGSITFIFGGILLVSLASNWKVGLGLLLFATGINIENRFIYNRQGIKNVLIDKTKSVLTKE